MKDQYPAGAHPDGAGTPALPSPEQLPLEIFMGILDIKETLRDKHQADAEAIGIDAIMDAAERYCQANPDKARTALECLQDIIILTKGSIAERTAARSQLILQRLSCADGETPAKEGSATTAQQVLLFYYLFNVLGVTFHTVSKAQIIRFIRWFTGRNEQNIKEKLDFQKELPKFQQDLWAVASQVDFLLPRVAQLIRNEISSLDPDELDKED
ncbi:MAG: hypothetical protein IJQ69_04900 [Bacteroidales bacterium]|nr:hypothetical protein [Bacteroidales bacterium]